MKIPVLFTFLILVARILANESNVIDLTPDNFDEIIGKEKFALVEFFAPWCGHCKSLAPIYEQLADAFSYAKDHVTIAKVNADEHRDLGKRFEVQGFPTLKWFGKGVLDKPEDYSGGRDLDSLIAYVEEKSGVKSRIKKAATAVTVLSSQTFSEIALDPKKNVLVEFYAPWCGHCKSLAPIYEKVAQYYSQEPDCIVANLDATAHKDIGEKYGVGGYPTLKFFPKGEDKSPINYEGGRTEQDLVSFLNEQCGKQRLVGGLLSEEAGKIAEMEALVTRFNNATTKAETDRVVTDSKAIADKLDNRFARYYVKVMEKIIGKSNYVDGEIARLDKIIKSGTISGSKIDDFTIRKNILTSFHKGDKVSAHEEL